MPSPQAPLSSHLGDQQTEAQRSQRDKPFASGAGPPSTFPSPHPEPVACSGFAEGWLWADKEAQRPCSALQGHPTPTTKQCPGQVTAQDTFLLLQVQLLPAQVPMSGRLYECLQPRRMVRWKCVLCFASCVWVPGFRVCFWVPFACLFLRPGFCARCCVPVCVHLPYPLLRPLQPLPALASPGP